MGGLGEAAFQDVLKMWGRVVQGPLNWMGEPKGVPVDLPNV